MKIVDFTLLGQRFQAISAGPHHEFNDAISIVVECGDQAELDRYWNALLENGGKPQACGWLVDRFGLRWQIVPAVLDEMMRDQDPARATRVTDAIEGYAATRGDDWMRNRPPPANSPAACRRA